MLENIGLRFRVEPSELVERPDDDLPPEEVACGLSFRKAVEVGRRNHNAIIIAADTIGVLDGRIIGKPRTDSEAAAMLESMSGKCHTVITGFTVADTETARTVTRSVETKVCFKRLTKADITAYVASGEPMDKAGSYGIQGLGSLLVERIEGDYNNVIGLPLSALAETLKEFGVDLLANASKSNGDDINRVRRRPSTQ